MMRISIATTALFVVIMSGCCCQQKQYEAVWNIPDGTYTSETYPAANIVEIPYKGMTRPTLPFRLRRSIGAPGLTPTGCDLDYQGCDSCNLQAPMAITYTAEPQLSETIVGVQPMHVPIEMQQQVPSGYNQVPYESHPAPYESDQVPFESRSPSVPSGYPGNNMPAGNYPLFDENGIGAHPVESIPTNVDFGRGNNIQSQRVPGTNNRVVAASANLPAVQPSVANNANVVPQESGRFSRLKSLRIPDMSAHRALLLRQSKSDAPTGSSPSAEASASIETAFNVMKAELAQRGN